MRPVLPTRIKEERVAAAGWAMSEGSATGVGPAAEESEEELTTDEEELEREGRQDDDEDVDDDDDDLARGAGTEPNAPPPTASEARPHLQESLARPHEVQITPRRSSSVGARPTGMPARRALRRMISIGGPGFLSVPAMSKRILKAEQRRHDIRKKPLHKAREG
jgi:hypothetical protein